MIRKICDICGKEDKSVNKYWHDYLNISDNSFGDICKECKKDIDLLVVEKVKEIIKYTKTGKKGE